MTTQTSKKPAAAPASSPTIFDHLLSVLRGAVTGALLYACVTVEPKPASRPRVSKWGTYHLKPYAEFMAECQSQLADIKTQAGEGRIVCALEFVCTKPKAGKLWTPKGDADNYAKGALDAMTKVEKAWRDDSQVTDLVASKRYARPTEVAAVHIYWGEAPIN